MCGVTHPDTYKGSDGGRRLRSDSFYYMLVVQLVYFYAYLAPFTHFISERRVVSTGS